MSRSLERLLSRAIVVAAFCLIGASVALVVQAFFVTPKQAQIALNVEAASNVPKAGAAKRRDPKITNLANLKMGQTIIPKVVVREKPPVPDLSTLIQVKGIFEYGDKKTNEALIEILRSGQTKSYHAGDTIEGVGASVIEVDQVVTISYDGKTMKMGVKNERAEIAPLASPGIQEPLANTKERK